MSGAGDSAHSWSLSTRLKSGARRLLGIHSQSSVDPLPELDWLGSEIHGYFVPAGLLDASSICYCVGAGDDITFDTELARIYGCRVWVVDPTPEGREHFNRVGEAVRRGESISALTGAPFEYRISAERFELLRYLEIGVLDTTGTVRFYAPARTGYVSHSPVMFQESGEYIDLPVDRLSRIMAREGHSAIDLLKLEIEGSEYRVIESVIEDKVDIKALLVEYDEVFWAKQSGRGHLFRIRESTRKLLRAGYRLAHSTDLFKRLFVREDVFERLAALPRSTPAGAGGDRP